MPTCYLVLGTPRSGTNAVAGVLHHLGVFMGERWIGEPDEWNGKGYFQCADFSELHSEMLEGWSVPPLDAHKRINDEQRQRHATLIQSRDVKDWGLSGVEVPWLIDGFCEHASNVKLIVTQRPFHESVSSWCDRTGETPHESCAALSRSRFMIDSVLSQWKSGLLTVDFHSLLDNPITEVHRIAEFTEKEPRPEAVAFIDRTLRRFGG